MTQDMQLRNFATGSVNVYVDCVARFARHFGTSPESLGPEDVRAFLLHLIEQRRVSWSYYNLHLQALRFLYNVTLGRPATLEHLVCPRRPKRLPVVLSPDELTRFFASVGSLKHRASLMTAYAADPTHLGAEIGFLAVLHTWGQNLQHHPHVHCVVPGGGLSPDGSRWVSCRPGFFLPVRVLGRLFRGKFLALLKAAFDGGRLSFHGQLAALADPAEFRRTLAATANIEWVVYAKPPFGGPEQVLKYLARYTHRVAISNHRLIGLEGDQVEFLWKDYADEGKQKRMKLKAVEFLRRFLQHVLPSGFVRIRHYGFLANRVCREKLELCRTLLAALATPRPVGAGLVSEPEWTAERGSEPHICPACGVGRMVIIETFPANRRGRAGRGPAPALAGCDTS